MKNINKLFTLVIVMAIFIGALLLISCEIKETEQNESFKVSFLYDGEEYKVLQTIDGKITLPKEPTKKDHVFEGWYLVENDQKFNPENKITKDIDVYAKWKVREYTLTFKDGDSVITTKNVVNWDEYKELPKLEDRYGYSYKWMLDEETEIKEGDFIKLTEDATINAVWIGNPYSVTLDSKEGQIVHIEVRYGSIYGELFTPTKEGYTFDGWYLGETKIEESSTVEIAENHTLTALWMAEKYTVSYYDGDAEIEYDANNPVEFNIEDGLTIQDPIKTGYKFNGWYYSNELVDENKVDFNNLPTHNIYLYPHFEELTFSIVYINMDGAVNNPQNLHSYNYFDDSIIIYQTDVTKLGYEFGGWYLDSAFNTPFNGENTHENLNIFAKWTIINYSLTLVLNGGTYNGEIPTTYNVETNIVLIDPQKQYYVFSGWYLDENFINMLDLEITYTVNITLYAKWELSPLLNPDTYIEMPYGLEQINVYKDTLKNVCLAFDVQDPILNTTISNDNALIYLTEEKNIIVIKKEFFDNYEIGRKIDVDVTFESGLVKRIYFTRINNNPYQLQAPDYDLSSIQEYLIRIIDSSVPVDILNVTIDGEVVPFTYSAGNITIAKQFISMYGVGTHLIKVYAENAISSTIIKVTNNQHHVPYNVKIDLDSSFPNIYVTWDYDLIADYIRVSIGGQEYYSNNEMHQHYFVSNKKFDATNILKIKDTSCIVTAYKDGNAYTSEEILMPISLYETVTSTTYIDGVEAIFAYPGETGTYGYSFYGKQNNFYITSMEEFYDLIAFMVRCPNSAVMQKMLIGETYYNYLTVYLDIDLEERTNYYVTYEGTPSLTDPEYVKTVMKTLYAWGGELAAISYAVSKLNTNSLNLNTMYQIILNTTTDNMPGEYNTKSNDYLCTEITALNHYGKGLEAHEKLPIDNVEKTAYCEDSVQLYLALENGYRPIFDENNATLAVLYQKVVSALRSIVDYDMNEYQIAIAIFDYLKNNVRYDHYVISPDKPTIQERHSYPCYFLEGVFDNKVAVCNGLAIAYSCMLNMMGIKAEKITGETADAGHAWVKFYIAGEWYLADPTWGDFTLESGSSKYEMINYNNLFITYNNSYTQGRVVTDPCDNSFVYEGDVYIDVFANMYYTYEGQTYDHIMESQLEYAILLSYLMSMCEVGGEVCTQVKAIDNNLLLQLRNIYITGVQVLSILRDDTLIIKVTRIS